MIKPRQLLHFKGFGGSCLSKTSGSRSEENLTERHTDKGRFEDDQSYKPDNQADRVHGAGMKTTKAAELQTTKIAMRSKGSAASEAQILWQPT